MRAKVIFYESFYKQNISVLNISQRARNVLLRNNLHSVEAVINNYYNLHRLRGCGTVVQTEVGNALISGQIEALDNEKLRKWCRDSILKTLEEEENED